MNETLYDWSVPPPRQEPPQFAAERGMSSIVWPLVVSRFPEAARDAASLDRLLKPGLADITPPFAFPGIREAAARLSAAIDAGGEIVVFGDFDADGVTATAILTSTIRGLGGRVRPFIPLRSEGYGLTDSAVARCLDGGTPALLVTVDCGITAGAALRRFSDLGVGIVVTDHHIPDGGQLPEGVILAAPHLEDVPPQCRNLCGAGVAFTLAAGLVATRHPQKDAEGIAARRRLFSWLDALSIATVADVMPLVGENRTIVTLGLRALSARPSTGLRQLLLATMDSVDVTERHLGFVLGPHINSAGRMADASLALDLMLAEDADVARDLAMRLKQTNALRRAECARADDAVRAQLETGETFNEEEDGAFVGAGEDWHPGVVGLAAAHVSDRLRRPAALVTFLGGEVGRGSVRGPAGYDVHAALAECAEHLVAFGGHESAAGLSVERSKLDAFRKAFSEACRRQAGGAAFITQTLDIAACVTPGEVGLPLLEEVMALAPFGEGNEEPVFEIDGVTAKADILGRETAKGLRLTICDQAGATVEGLWFGAADRYPDFREKRRWDFAATLLPDDYGGRHSVKLRILDARPHS